MHKLFALGLFAFIMLSLHSCGKNERVTESGLSYTVLNEGTGEVAENGQYLLLNMKYGEEDSTWIDTSKENLPTVILVRKPLPSNEASIMDIFQELKSDDSISFTTSISELFLKTWRRPVPNNLDSAGQVTFNVGVEAIMGAEDFQKWQTEQQNKIDQNQLNYDLDVIATYLSENNIDAQKTESGLHYVIVENATGIKPENGQTVAVNYTGYNLKGEYFDSSSKEVAEDKGIYNTAREPYEPIEFVLGTGGVIKGWDEGIALLNVGTKAKLIIPSTLAYGQRSRGPAIGPNEILVFDIELVEIK